MMAIDGSGPTASAIPPPQDQNASELGEKARFDHLALDIQGPPPLCGEISEDLDATDGLSSLVQEPSPLSNLRTKGALLGIVRSNSESSGDWSAWGKYRRHTFDTSRMDMSQMGRSLSLDSPTRHVDGIRRLLRDKLGIDGGGKLVQIPEAERVRRGPVSIQRRLSRLGSHTSGSIQRCASASSETTLPAFLEQHQAPRTLCLNQWSPVVLPRALSMTCGSSSLAGGEGGARGDFDSGKCLVGPENVEQRASRMGKVETSEGHPGVASVSDEQKGTPMVDKPPQSLAESNGERQVEDGAKCAKDGESPCADQLP